MLAMHLGAKADAETQKAAITPVEASAKAGAIVSAKAGAQSDFSLDAKAIRALEMTAAGATQVEIVEKVWGATGKGTAYKKASAEYRDLLKSMAQRQLTGGN